MGLETATYISELDTSNPTGPGDLVAQGDDHLRLIKRVVMQTFPNADRAIYFAQMQTLTSSYTAVGSDAGSLFLCDASGGAITVTLPAIVDSEGFILGIKKIDSGTNAVTIDGAGAETIDGETDHELTTQWDVLWLWCDGTAWYIVDRMYEGDRGLPRGQLWGLTLSNNATDATNDLDIAVGEARSATDDADLVLASALTKRLDAVWAVGTNQGMRDTGSIADGWWYIHLIKRLDTGVVDVLASLSATAPTFPTDYTVRRRIGAILRVSSAITGFQQYGDDFLITQFLSEDANNPGTSVVSVTMRAPVLSGIVIHGRIYGTTISAGATYVLVTSPLNTDSTPVGNLHTLYFNNAPDTTLFRVISSTGIVRYRLSASNAGTTIKVWTIGWTDARGRDR